MGYRLDYRVYTKDGKYWRSSYIYCVTQGYAFKELCLWNLAESFLYVPMSCVKVEMLSTDEYYDYTGKVYNQC